MYTRETVRMVGKWSTAAFLLAATLAVLGAAEKPADYAAMRSSELQKLLLAQGVHEDRAPWLDAILKVPGGVRGKGSPVDLGDSLARPQGWTPASRPTAPKRR